MVLQRHASGTSHTLRVCGFAAAYAFAMATGTAVLIGALGAFEDGHRVGPEPTATAADVLVRQTAERSVPRQDAVFASTRIPNDKRGF